MVKMKTERTLTLQSLDFINYISDPIRLKYYEAGGYVYVGNYFEFSSSNTCISHSK